MYEIICTGILSITIMFFQLQLASFTHFTAQLNHTASEALTGPLIMVKVLV